MEDEAIAFDDNDRSPAFDGDERDSGATIRTVSISYALTPVATSTREVLSISAVVNLSSIVEGLFAKRYFRRAKLYESSNGWQVYDFQVGHCLCARIFKIEKKLMPQKSRGVLRKNRRAEGFVLSVLAIIKSTSRSQRR